MASGQGGFLCSCVSYAKGTGIMDSLGLRLSLDVAAMALSTLPVVVFSVVFCYTDCC